MWYVGFCPRVVREPSGVRICSSGRHTVAMCDECDAVWQSPELDSPPTYVQQPGLPCPDCGESLLNAPAHWATLDEVQQAGWQDSLIGQGPALGDT